MQEVRLLTRLLRRIVEQKYVSKHVSALQQVQVWIIVSVHRQGFLMSLTNSQMDGRVITGVNGESIELSNN